MPAIGSAWIQVAVIYYLFALLFLAFHGGCPLPLSGVTGLRQGLCLAGFHRNYHLHRHPVPGHRLSALAAYTVFWLVFVASCTSLPIIYGWRGEVPVVVVQWSVFFAMMLIVGVTSLTTLIQYGRGGGTGEA